MLKLDRDWRSSLAGVAPPDLVYSEQSSPRSELTGNPEDEERRPPENSRVDLDRRYDENTTNKNAPAGLVEDEPAGYDFKEGSPNFSQAFSLEFHRLQRIINTFAIIVSKVAEDLAGWPIEGDDEWSIPRLMSRRITREPVGNCRQSREKDSVVVILDTSGSCLPQARFYNRIAAAAVQVGDVELYAAPNAGLESRRSRHGWQTLPDKAWPFRQRTIIFFGDYDGGDAVVEASWHNKVYWFCSEGTRYPSMAQHPWCSYTMRYFRGRYFDCNNDDDFLRLLRKVR